MADDPEKIADDDTSPEHRLETALARFKLLNEAESKQRQRELKSLEFYAGDQWPDYVKQAREGNTVGDQANVGKKPCLTINKVKQPVQQIINQQKNANLGILLRPEKDANADDAKIRQGLIRHIQAKSRAKIARDWAFDRMAQVGRGYYKITKEYVYKTRRDAMQADPAALLDQELVVRRFLNQGNVGLDPFAQQPDWSDGDWAFEWDDMPIAKFKRENPKAKLSQADDSELTAVAERNPGWINGEGEARTVRVANYWDAVYKPVTLQVIRLANGSSQITDQPEKDWPDGTTAIGKSLRIMDRTIRCCQMTATEILPDSETEWEGKHIPIIPEVGNEYNLNGVRLWNGEVEDSMDAQRLFNYTASAIALATALAPLAPFIVDPKQIEGFEKLWDQANIRQFPYLPAHAFDEQQRPYPPPARNSTEPPIQALAIMLNQADSYIQATTATPDTSLGRFDPKKASGKAVEALQRTADLANSNYLDNHAHISMSLEGIILNEMLQYVYDRPGRIVEILGETGESSQVMLGQPFMRGQDGQPQAIPEGQPAPADTFNYDLSKGTYAIVVDVVKSEPTRRAEIENMILEMAATSPQASAALTPLLAKYSDMAGADEIFGVLKKLLWPPDMQSDGKGVNWEMQAKQAAAQIQQLTQVVQQLQKIIDTKQIEGGFDVQIAEIQAKAAVRRAEVAAIAQLDTTGLKTTTQKQDTLIDRTADKALQDDQQAFEAAENAKDRALDLQIAAQQRAAAEAQARATANNGESA